MSSQLLSSMLLLALLILLLIVAAMLWCAVYAALAKLAVDIPSVAGSFAVFLWHLLSVPRLVC
jgi:hypothetical protein